MKLLYVLLCVTYATCFHIGVEESSKDKIVNGVPVSIRNFRHQASLEYKGNNICGASIISGKWMALGAQCVDPNEFPDMKVHGKFRFGTQLLESEGETRGISNIVPHEDFDGNTLENDIAAAEVDEEITFNGKQHLIRLAKAGPNVGDDISISGFGALEHYFEKTKKYRLSDILRSLMLKVLDDSACNANLSKNMFCVAPGASFGDAGGPGVVNGELSGIMSYGDQGASPSVYMKVSEYYQWFLDNTDIPRD